MLKCSLISYYRGQAEDEVVEEEGSPPEFTGEPPDLDARFVIRPQAEKLRQIIIGKQDEDDVSSSASSPRASFSTESRGLFQHHHPLTLVQKCR